MSNYGTQTRSKYTMPYTYANMTRIKPLSRKAEMRLKWMDYIDKGKSISECARHFDHPYRTVKYWRDRYNRFDLSSLEDRSRRPKRYRSRETTSKIEQIIYEARKYELPGAGKVTLQKYILNEYGIKVGQQAIQRVINEQGLRRVRKPRKKKLGKNRRHMYSVPKKVMNEPGGLVYLDVKHLKIDRKKWYQFTALDHSTRMLGVKLYRKITSESAKEFFKYLDSRYPFEKIQYIGTDNGSEFLGTFDEYLEERNIKHVFSSPASPKQNPFVERVIRTIIEQLYKVYGLEDDPSLQQQALDDFCYRYNYKRPHQSLGLLTPIQMYDKLISDFSHNSAICTRPVQLTTFAFQSEHFERSLVKTSFGVSKLRTFLGRLFISSIISSISSCSISEKSVPFGKYLLSSPL